MAIQTRPHIQDNGCKLTPSFKKYFNKDFVINSLSKIAKRKSLKDKMYCEEDFKAQNFEKKKKKWLRNWKLPIHFYADASIDMFSLEFSKKKMSFPCQF